MSMQSTIEDLRKYRSLVLLIFIFCMVSTLSFLAARSMQHSSAASLSNFKPGNIISDAVMGNYNSMTKDQIQAFLTKKNPCNNTNASQYQSLKAQYPNIDWHFENGHFVCLSEEKFGDGTVIGQGQTAAEIIYQAAQDYRINPQVILVLLEKEQSLITDTYPNSKQYRSATGYGCPDTAACDAKYYGFKNQVRNAAALFRNVLDNGYSAYPEKKQGVYIGYNPNSSCGRSEVYIENRATAALYRYTPYQPNAAAIAAGYGAGDACSAYGNRNFYLYFVDWFGSTQVQSEVKGEKISIPESEFSFVSQVASGTRALGVAAGNGNGTSVQVVAQNDSDARQKWRVEKTSDGYYRIIHVATNKALDIANGSAISDGAKLQLWDRSDSCVQKWNIYAVDYDGNIAFESACMRGMVLSLSNSTATVGSAIQMWNANGGTAQNWQLHVGRTLSDGLYTLNSAINSKRVADAAGAGNINGTNIIYWDQLGVGNQEWYLQYHSQTDSYSIVGALSGKALDVANGKKVTSGANVQLWDYNGSCVQQWKIIPRNGKYMLLSGCSVGYALDLTGGADYNGNNIQIWSVHNESPELWQINRVSPAIANGTYYIALKNDPTKVIALDNSSAAVNSNVSLYTKRDTASYKWQFTYHEKEGNYTITNAATGKVLDLAGMATRNGNTVQTWQNLNNCAQRWYLEKNTGDSYHIISSCNIKKAVDMEGGIIRDGANIQIWDKNTFFAQQWVIQ